MSLSQHAYIRGFWRDCSCGRRVLVGDTNLVICDDCLQKVLYGARNWEKQVKAKEAAGE